MATKVKQPTFEYEIVSDYVYVFKAYKGRDILLILKYLSAYNVFVAHVDEFYTQGMHQEAGGQSGIFTISGQQLPFKVKHQKFNSKLCWIINSNEPNIKQNYYPLVKSAIQFYKQIFPQGNYNMAPNV